MQGSWIACGGLHTGGTVTHMCWMYDKDSKEWKNDFDMKTKRRGWTGIQLNEDEYWIAGID